MAAELFGYSTQQLIGIKMSQLFADVHKEKQEALVEQHIEASGAVVMVNGKVVSNMDSFSALMLLFNLKILSYSQLSLRQTPSGPAPTVRLREVSAL